jgi:hypothetical protein
MLAVVIISAMAGASWAQCQRAKLQPPDLTQGAECGHAVGVDGDWAIIGAPGDDDIASQSGAAYVYHRANGAWQQTQKLKASDASFGDSFGTGIALGGTRAVIAAYTDAPLGVHGAGSVYVFDLEGSTWVQRAKLWAQPPTPNTFFGLAVDISGGRIVVGSSNASPVGLSSGQAWVFEGSGSSWTQVAALVPSDAAQGDGFGTSVAIDGPWLAVGASSADVAPSFDHGAAYVFESPSAGAWVERQKLLASDGVSGDGFGVRAAIAGDTLILTAVGHATSGGASGAAYLFERAGLTWVERQRLVASDAHPAAGFGTWVSMDGELALLGASGSQDTGSNNGAAYAFCRVGAGWVQIGKLIANDGDGADLFGSSVALSGTTAIAGAIGRNEACPTVPACFSGAAYVFELAPSAVQYGSCAPLGPCGNTDAHGGCRNSTGFGTVLQACGSGSAVTDDLTLEVRNIPPGVPAVLYMGAGQMSAPFGDGRRVVAAGGAGLFRLGAQTSDGDGVIVRGPGIVAQSQGLPAAGRIAAGQSWNFQCLYRNVVGPCGSGFNLSNGLAVTFAP